MILYSLMSRRQQAQQIEFIARAILVDGDEVLLCRNVKHGYLYLPGGHVEPGERAGEACLRELAEETELTARVAGWAGMAEVMFAAGGKDHHEINVMFHVEPTGASAESRAELRKRAVSREPAIAFEWVPISEIARRDVRPPVIRNWLAEALGRDGPHPPCWLSERDR